MRVSTFASRISMFAMACVLAVGPQLSFAATTTNGDVLETGISGEVPLIDQVDGKSAAGYHRGLEVIGNNRILNRGTNFAMAWVGHCAYVTTTSLQQLFGALNTPYVMSNKSPLNGMAVIDVTNPRAPALVDILQSPAMLDPHESIQGNDARHIIVATSSMGNMLDVYDASNCDHPVLKTTLYIGTGSDTALGTQGVTFRGHASPNPRKTRSRQLLIQVGFWHALSLRGLFGFWSLT